MQNDLYHACKKDDVQQFKLLITNDKINVHFDNDFIFIFACQNGKFNIVKYLVKEHITTNMLYRYKYYKINLKYYGKIKNIINSSIKCKCFFDNNNKLTSYKIIFPLYNLLTLTNCVYFGII